MNPTIAASRTEPHPWVSGPRSLSDHTRFELDVDRLA